MASRAFDGVVTGEDGVELQQLTVALAGVGPTARERLTDAAATQLTAAYTQELADQPRFNALQDRFVAHDPKVALTDRGFVASTGHPSGLAPQFEFGTLHRDELVTYRRRNRGGRGRHEVTRRTKRQLPPRSQTGWIAYPAGDAVVGRAIRLMQQLVVKTFYDALEGGKS